MKSDNIKAGIARTPHRGLLMATGVSRKNMKAPFIGIASSFSDLVPGHIGMRDLERQIEKVFIPVVDKLLFLEFLQYVMVLLWDIAECDILYLLVT